MLNACAKTDFCCISRICEAKLEHKASHYSRVVFEKEGYVTEAIIQQYAGIEEAEAKKTQSPVEEIEVENGAVSSAA